MEKNMRLLVVSKIIVFLAIANSMVAVQAFEEDTPVNWVFASDPQYPWTDKSDSGEDESQGVKEERSAKLITQQYQSIAQFRQAQGGADAVPVMINGDMTAYGHSGERSYINKVLQKELGGRYDYGLGNHDYENNVDDCFLNGCAAGSLDEYIARYWVRGANIDLFSRAESGFARVFYGSLAYAKDWGRVHLIQLNNEPTYTVNIESGVFLARVKYEITSALDWLEKDLEMARQAGKIIIINVHKPQGWDGNREEFERFKQMIEKYEVTAVFAGHYHGTVGKYRADRGLFGEVPVFLSGSASQQTYLVASLSADYKQLEVYAVHGNDWRNRKLESVIDIK